MQDHRTVAVDKGSEGILVAMVREALDKLAVRCGLGRAGAGQSSQTVNQVPMRHGHRGFLPGKTAQYIVPGLALSARLFCAQDKISRCAGVLVNSLSTFDH